MSFKSPLGRVKGLGPARNGLHHWWMQRLTALGLIPLTLWFVASVARYHLASYAVLIEWLKNPFVVTAVIIYFGVLLYHSALGVQAVVEDYVSHPATRMTALIVSTFAHILLGTVATVAVLKIAFGGG